MADLIRLVAGIRPWNHVREQLTALLATAVPHGNCPKSAKIHPPGIRLTGLLLSHTFENEHLKECAKGTALDEAFPQIIS